MKPSMRPQPLVVAPPSKKMKILVVASSVREQGRAKSDLSTKDTKVEVLGTFYEAHEYIQRHADDLDLVVTELSMPYGGPDTPPHRIPNIYGPSIVGSAVQGGIPFFSYFTVKQLALEDGVLESMNRVYLQDHTIHTGGKAKSLPYIPGVINPRHIPALVDKGLMQWAKLLHDLRYHPRPERIVP